MAWIIIVILLIVIIFLITEIWDLLKTNKSKQFAMNTLLQIQELDGAYNYNEYELGMWQGMENMLAKFEDRKPRYKEIGKIKFIDSYRNK